MPRFTHYSDAELVRHCDNSMNNLTTTDLEKELCLRLDALLQERGQNQPFLDILEKHNYDDAEKLDVELTAFLAVEQVLNDNGMSMDAEALGKVFTRFDTICDAIRKALGN